MADSTSHRFDLRVGGEYRFGKMMGSGSSGASSMFSWSQPFLSSELISSQSSSNWSPWRPGILNPSMSAQGLYLCRLVVSASLSFNGLEPSVISAWRPSCSVRQPEPHQRVRITEDFTLLLTGVRKVASLTLSLPYEIQCLVQLAYVVSRCIGDLCL